MKWFVYYSDDHYDLGGVGFEEFDEESRALSFIEKRLSENENSKLSNYRIIHGSEKCLQSVEVVTKVVALDRV